MLTITSNISPGIYRGNNTSFNKEKIHFKPTLSFDKLISTLHFYQILLFVLHKILDKIWGSWNFTMGEKRDLFRISNFVSWSLMDSWEPWMMLLFNRLQGMVHLWGTYTLSWEELPYCQLFFWTLCHVVLLIPFVNNEVSIITLYPPENTN